jgi:hypothetical protein
MKQKLSATHRALVLLLAVASDVRPQHRDQIAEIQNDLETEAAKPEPKSKSKDAPETEPAK